MLGAPAAHAGHVAVLVVPPFDPATFAGRGAVGLLVPGAGPSVSRESALAGLLRGKVRNSLLGGTPGGKPLIRVGGPPKAITIYLALPPRGMHANSRRYPIAIVGGGYRGLLVTDSTRVPGLVSVADVAPTVLALDDRRRPDIRWGQAPHRGQAPDRGQALDAARALERLDERIEEKGPARVAATWTVVVLILLLAVVAPHAAVLAFATALAANLVLGAAGITDPWTASLLIGAAVAAGAPILARAARSRTATGIVFAAVIAAYAVAMALDATTVALSPLGPTQNARFYGLSNLLATLLLVPALAGAVFL